MERKFYEDQTIDMVYIRTGGCHNSVFDTRITNYTFHEDVMEVRVDVDDIRIEVRCNKCGNVMHISEQYEYHDTLTVDIEPCDECEDEEPAQVI